MNSHSIIHKNAKIGKNVEIGPFCTIGKNVEIKENCKIHSNVVIDGNTIIGEKYRDFSFCNYWYNTSGFKVYGRKDKNLHWRKL